MDLARSDEGRQTVRDLTPMGHFQRPEDLYGPIMFLASRASDYVTGIDLLVDGGHTLNTWLEPLPRAVPARVNREQEIVHLTRDLAMMSGTNDKIST